jgi:hypothetical protein
MFGILGIEFESSLEKRDGDAFALAPQRRTRRRAFRYNFNINVFRHALDHAVGAAQCRATLEDELKWALVRGGDCGKRLDDEPILFDKCRVRQPELSLHFHKLLKCGPIVQVPAPCSRL